MLKNEKVRDFYWYKRQEREGYRDKERKKAPEKKDRKYKREKESRDPTGKEG